MALRASIIFASEFGLRLPTLHGFSKDGKSNGPSGNELGRAVNRMPSVRKTDADRGGRGDLIQAVRGNSNKHFTRVPTVVKSEARKGFQDRTTGKKGTQESLTTVVLKPLRTPTPTASMMTEADLEQAKFSGSDSRRPSYQEAKRMPTMTVYDGTGGPGRAKNKQEADNLRTEVGGSLNPEWVEWLMGWPIGWSALAPLETDSFRKWLDSHGAP